MGIATDFIVKNGLQANGLIKTTSNSQANQFLSTAPQGTPPFTVQSNTLIANLNAAYVGGISAASLPSLTADNTWLGLQTLANGTTFAITSGTNQRVNFNIGVSSGTPSIIYNHTSDLDFRIGFSGNSNFRHYLLSTNTALTFVALGNSSSINAISIGVINGNVTIGGTQTIINSNTTLSGVTNIFNGTASFNNTATFGSTAQFNAGAAITGNFGLSFNTGTVNGTSYSGTSNNALNLGGVGASGYLTSATNSTITAATLTFSANNTFPQSIVFTENSNILGAIATSNLHVLSLQFANSTGSLFNALTLDTVTGNVVIAGGQSLSIQVDANVATNNVYFNANNVSFSGNVFLTQPLSVTSLSVGNSTVNTTVNSTSFTGTANNALNLNGANNYAQLNAVTTFTANVTVVGTTKVVDNNLWLQSNTNNSNVEIQLQGTAGLLRHTLRSTNNQFQILYANTTGVIQSLPAITYDLTTGNTTQYSPVTYVNTAITFNNTANAEIDILFQANGTNRNYILSSNSIGLGLAYTNSTGSFVGTALAVAPLTGAITVTTNTNFSNAVVNNAQLQCYKETLTNTAVSTATTSIDLSTANFFHLTLSNSAITASFTNPPAAGNAFSFTVVLTQDATGGRVVTWPATVKWTNGTTPTQQAGVSKSDVFTFFTMNGGTTYAGTYAIANTAL